MDPLVIGALGVVSFLLGVWAARDFSLRWLKDFQDYRRPKIGR